MKTTVKCAHHCTPYRIHLPTHAYLHLSHLLSGSHARAHPHTQSVHDIRLPRAPTHVMAPTPLPPLDLPDYWGDRPPPPTPPRPSTTSTARRRRPPPKPAIPTDVSLADYATSEFPDLQLFFRAIVTVARRSINNGKQNPSSRRRSPSYSSSIGSDVEDNTSLTSPNSSPDYRPRTLPSISVESLTSMDDDEDRERERGALDCTTKPPRMPASPSYLVHSISQLWFSITDTLHNGTRAPPPSPLPPFTTHFAPSRSTGELECIARRAFQQPKLRHRPNSARLHSESLATRVSVRQVRRPPSAAPVLSSWNASAGESRRSDEWSDSTCDN